MLLRPALVGMALSLLLAAGCGPAKLNETKTLQLNKETMAAGLDLSAQKKPQTVTVEFSSSDGEVSVGVFKMEDLKDDDAMVIVPSSKAIGNKVVRGKSDTFSVEIPENTATRVVVRGHTAAKTDVTLKVTNAK